MNLDASLKDRTNILITVMNALISEQHKVEVKNTEIQSYKNLETKLEKKSKEDVLGPAVQSIISLTSSLVVKLLTVLVSTISNSQVFLLKTCE